MPRTPAFLAAFAKRLKDIRTQRDYSQKRLSREAGLNHTALTKLETGEQDPHLSTVCKIAVALGVPMTELIPPPEEYFSDTGVFEIPES